MIEENRTKSEYIRRFAHDYCGGKEEAAREHAIAKAVCEELKEEGVKDE